jgi:hypothetical protein
MGYKFVKYTVPVILNNELKYVTLPSVLFALIKSGLLLLQSELPFHAK